MKGCGLVGVARMFHVDHLMVLVDGAAMSHVHRAVLTSACEASLDVKCKTTQPQSMKVLPAQFTLAPGASATVDVQLAHDGGLAQLTKAKVQLKASASDGTSESQVIVFDIPAPPAAVQRGTEGAVVAVSTDNFCVPVNQTTDAKLGFTLRNKTSAPCEFKIKTTNPKAIKTQPSSGSIDAGATLAADLHILRPVEGFGGFKGKVLVQVTPGECTGLQGESLKIPIVTDESSQHLDPVPHRGPDATDDSQFRIAFRVPEVIAMSITNARRYAIDWKRGTTQGRIPFCVGGGGRVAFPNEVVIPGCKAQRKADGSVAKRLLHLTMVACDVNDDEDDHMAAPSSVQTLGTVKVDASTLVTGTRNAELPVQVGSAQGVLCLVLTMDADDSTSSARPVPEAETQVVPSVPPVADEQDEATQPRAAPAPAPARQRRQRVEVPKIDFDERGTMAAPSAAASSSATGDVAAVAGSAPASTTSNVCVCVRVRPLLRGIESNELGWKLGENGHSLQATDENGALYEYDHVLEPKSSNNDVFKLVAPRFIDGAVEGINGTLFMYGQTASGKTHTMFGEENEPGMTQLVIRGVFDKLQAKMDEYAEKQLRAKASVTVAYFEIYNEELNDLLDPSRRNLTIRASRDGGFAAAISTRTVRDAAAALAVIQEGSHNKKMGQSELNDRSSRSHTICQLTCKTMVEGAGGKRRVTSAEVNLVDLAGSESLSDKGDAANKKETSHINLSLSYLKKVIGELAHKASFVSYRNSSLTKILKQALGGNSRTTVICCVTPSKEHQRDTRNTLAFGTTAKSVVLTARVNAADSGEAGAREEVKKLKLLIQNYQAAIAAYKGIEADYDAVQNENDELRREMAQLQAELTAERKRPRAAAASTVSPDGEQATAHDGDGGADGGEPQLTRAQSQGRLQQRHSAVLRGDPSESNVGDEGTDAAQTEVVDVGERPDADGAEASEGVDPASPTANADVDDVMDQFLADAEADEQAAMEREAVSVVATPTGDDDFADAVDVGDEPVPAPPRPGAAGAPPASRPDPNAQPVHMTEVQLLRRDLHRLRIEHRNTVIKKNTEIRQLMEQQVASSVINEVPEVKSKDDRIATLLDQINSFLRYGTQFSQVVEVKKKKDPMPVRHLFVNQTTGGSILTWCGLTADGERDKSNTFGKIDFADIKRLELGQDSEGFTAMYDAWEKQLKLLSADAVKGSATASDEIRALQTIMHTARHRARMSFTIVAKKKKTLDVMCQNEADFEAWVVGLNRLLGSSADWKKPMAIPATLPMASELDPEEREFCAALHVYPKEYMRARNALLGGGPRLVTLFDLRTYSGLDLYHSQRFFFFARCRGWVDSASIYYVTQSAADMHEGTFADVGDDGGESRPDGNDDDDGVPHDVEIVDEADMQAAEADTVEDSVQSPGRADPQWQTE